MALAGGAASLARSGVRRASTVRAVAFKGVPAVELDNGSLNATILTGGGHIAALRLSTPPASTAAADTAGIAAAGAGASAAAEAASAVNPLWEPPWPLRHPSQRNIPDEDNFGSPDNLESVFLQTIAGHNLCADVFGDHSAGEVAKSDLTFHGEAGMCSWLVRSASASEERGVSVSMEATLPASALKLVRRYTLAPGANTMAVAETVESTLGIERPFGRAEHATIGEAMLRNGSCVFSCNADKGMTWPDDFSDELPQRWRAATEFDYPLLPTRDGVAGVLRDDAPEAAAGGAGAEDGADDWRRYPHAPKNSDLCTLRVRREDDFGWFVADQRHSEGVGVAIAYAWKRADFPWLMTWEENRARDHKPWNGRVLARGLEFSSYAFARGRKDNVERGKSLLDTPAHEWLDAYEKRETVFHVGLFGSETGGDGTPVELVRTAAGLSGGGIEIPLQ